jgi:hypothetical protein
MGRDENEEPKRGFKVDDRRRFVEGAEDTPAETPRAEPASSFARAEAPSAPEAPPAGASHEDLDPEGHGELNFSTFVMGLSTQALMHLGEIAEPGQPHAPDLPAAKQMIDLLGILREKTTGNLDADEEQLLASMLYDLRMRYVEVSRHR